MSSIKKDVYKYLLPNLLETQRISFCWFLELGFIQELENFSAIRDYLDELELNLSAKFFKIRHPKYTLAEAKRRDTTYSVRVYTLVQLIYLNNLSQTNENVLLKDFYPNLEKLGWEATFQKTFQKTSDAFYLEFEDFLKKQLSEVMLILPKH